MVVLTDTYGALLWLYDSLVFLSLAGVWLVLETNIHQTFGKVITLKWWITYNEIIYISATFIIETSVHISIFEVYFKFNKKVKPASYSFSNSNVMYCGVCPLLKLVKRTMEFIENTLGRVGGLIVEMQPFRLHHETVRPIYIVICRIPTYEFHYCPKL